jgi:hypothetical protein
MKSKSLSLAFSVAVFMTQASPYAFAGEATLTKSTDRLFDDRPEYFFMDRPSFEYGSRLGHISDIKREKDFVLNGHIRYSKEDGKLNDWVDATYENKPAWLHSRGARAVLARFGVGDPAAELKRVTTPQQNVALAAAAPSKANSTWQSASPTFSYANRAPAATLPIGGFQNGVANSAQALPTYQSLASLGASVGSASAGGASAGPNGATAPQNPDTKWTNPTGSGASAPICAKSKPEYDENKILQKAFEGSKDPFTAWADRENDAILSPNGQGQWDLVVKGALLRTLPIQVCVEKEGAEPYLSVYNKRFDIKDNGTLQTVHLDDGDGRSRTFSSAASRSKQKSTSKQNTLQ